MKACLYRFIQQDQKNILAKVLKGFLWLLSLVYLGAVKSICWFYQIKVLPRKYLPRPVISIGNLTLGGTGKTPLTGFVVDALKKKGYTPAILIRGYGATKGFSDEVELYKELLPEICLGQGRNRFTSGLKILKENSKVNVFVMDDGFQHWSLDRDLDIVVVDATNPFGNEFLLPRGILREPLSALKRADIIVLTKVDLAKENCANIYTAVRKNNFHAIFVESIYEPIKLVNLKDRGIDKDILELKGHDVAVFSALGNSQGFEKTIQALGGKVQKAFSFLDHHVYTKADLQKMMDEARAQSIKMFITTQKDAVKLRSLENCFPKDIDFFALAISFKIIKGEKEFKERVDAALRR
jgi:tetraacyldisaccharide 4'-kinase